MSLVLYRKYRPKSFSEVIGQEKIVKILTSAVASGRIAHAYLFTGPRGIGKTTIARILAKSINCENPKNGEPCNKCPNCLTINEGKTFDVIEIDAASNTGVDNIRDLKATIGFSPSVLRYKVFIIDEAHMLSKGAFNALLKTLEEPPEHAIFILATTEIHKIPATIISRSQRFDFRKLKLGEMAVRLKQMAENEKIRLGKGVAELIASSSDGGMRDAESLLGQIISLETDGEEISLEEVKSILGLSDAESVMEFVGFLGKNRTSEAIIFLNEINFGGQDLEQFMGAVVNVFRKLLILKANPDLRSYIAGDSTEEQIKKISGLADDFSEQELLWFVKKFINAKNEIRSAVLPQMPPELAIIEFDLLKNKKIFAGVKTPEVKSEVLSGKKAEKKIAVEPEKSPETKIKVKKQVSQEAKKEDVASEIIKEKEAGDIPASGDISEIVSGWNGILKAAKNYNHSISAFLKLSAPKEIKKNSLVIATPYKFHAEKLGEPANRRIIEKVIAEVFPKMAGIKIQVVQDENIKIMLTAKAEKISTAEKEEKTAADSSVQSVIDIFGGEVE
jgi:DNA polymerase III subunit gamma/tau